MVKTKKKSKKKSKARLGPGDKLQGSIILLHGPYKVGKTTLAASFPGCQFIATEPGHKYLPDDVEVNMLNPDNAWEEFTDWVGSSWDKNTKTVVIDIIDNLYRQCRKWYCKKENIRHPRDQPYLGWDMLRDEFTNWVEKLFYKCAKKNITLIFVTHTKEEEVETESGTFTKYMTTLTGQARSIICPLPDHVWFLGYYSEMDEPDADAVKAAHDDRTLWLRGGTIVEAGCQDPKMKRKKILKLKEEGAYEQIVALMNKPLKTKTKE